MIVKVSLIEEISGGGKNGGDKEVGFAMRRRRVNRRSINIRERDKGGVVW